MVEVSAEEYENLEKGEPAVLAETIMTVEVRQADGLLAVERTPIWIDRLGLHNAMKLGVADGGVPVSVLLGAEEEQDGRSDADAAA